ILPGRPNPVNSAYASCVLAGVPIFVYSTGNNVVILRDWSVLTQVLRLESDASAISVNEESGSIAVSVSTSISVFLYDSHSSKWFLSQSFSHSSPTPATTLHWTSPTEIVSASTSLSLWSLSSNSSSLIWSIPIPHPCALSSLSHDSVWLATVARNDHLVKAWRRLSFDYDNPDFDFVYLPHPAPLRLLQWRVPFSPTDSQRHTLYTFASDNIFRVWAPIDDSSSGSFHLWLSVDLSTAFPSSPKFVYPVILTNYLFSRSCEHAVARSSASAASSTSSTLSRLAQLASSLPEIVVCLDDSGRMCAWSIEGSASSDPHLLSVLPVFADGFEVPCFPRGVSSFTFTAYPALGSSDQFDLHFIFHDFSGIIYHFSSCLDRLLDQAPSLIAPGRLELMNLWTGHYKSVRRLDRNLSGSILLSTSDFWEATLWRPKTIQSQLTLNRECVITFPTKSHACLVLDESGHVLSLHESKILLFECSTSTSKLVASYSLPPDQCNPICFMHLPTVRYSVSHAIIAMYADKSGALYDVQENSRITLAQKFVLPLSDDLESVFPVDPASRADLVSTEFLDRFQTEVLITTSPTGTVRTWTARVSKVQDDPLHIEWLQISSFETGLEGIGLARGSTTRTLALTDKSGRCLQIWNTEFGLDRLEYQEIFDNAGEYVQGIDWTYTPSSQNVLSIDFPHKVRQYCQLRYDYARETPAWVSFREIDIRNISTHTMGDSIWLDKGVFVMSFGNQLMVHSKHLDVSHANMLLQLGAYNASIDNIFEIVSLLNGPLVYYHPQLVIQAIFLGKLHVVHKIFIHLARQLSADEWNESKVANISSDLGLDIEVFLQGPDPDFDLDGVVDMQIASGNDAGSATSVTNGHSFASVARFSRFDDTVVDYLRKRLTMVSLPYLTGHQQISLIGVLESLADMERDRRSLDRNALRFLLSFKLYMIHPHQSSMHSRDFNWALHSESQGVLVGIISKAFNNTLLWKNARDCGMFFWLKDEVSVRTQMEILAKNHFTQGEHRDPVNCSLFYLALRKKTVLLGLWKICGFHKDQAKTLAFLQHDFTEPRWKTAALKNAFALLSKHNYEYAAAFFLLGDALWDAARVCIRQLHDIQLAVAICRAYEGDKSPSLVRIYREEILQNLALSCDRWLSSLVFWSLGEHDSAVQILVNAPVELRISRLSTPSDEHKTLKAYSLSFLVMDPVLIVLYKELSAVTLRTRVGDLAIPPDVEWQFLLRVAYLYDRMGCDVLALDIVKNWKF
ncbi:hypothetical protein CANCADRAFT_17983, partial [Tortispora caseinolytica NRRL Y-17796]